MPLRRVLKFAFFVLFFLAQTNLAVAQPKIFYVIQKGDTVTNTLHRLGLNPIYTQNGSLNAVVSLNPGKAPMFPHHLLPGETIVIPSEYGPLIAQHAQILDSGEIRFKTGESHPSREVATTAPTELPARESNPKPATLAETYDPQKKSTRETVLKAALGGTFTSLEGTDTVSGSAGRLNTGFSPVLEVAWLQPWNLDVESEFFFKYVQYEFPDFETIRVAHSKKNIANFGFRFGKQWDNGSRIVLGLSSQERFFYRTLATNSFSIENVVTPQIDLSGKLPLLNLQPFAIGITGGVFASSQARLSNYEVESSIGQVAGIYLVETRPTYTILGEINYRSDAYRVNDTPFGRSDLSGTVSITFEWPAGYK